MVVEKLAALSEQGKRALSLSPTAKSSSFLEQRAAHHDT